MYQIISNGVIVDVCETPRYIKKNADGNFVQCEESEAIGIAAKGVAYNLEGHNEIEIAVYDEENESTSVETAPEAFAKEVDAGSLVFASQQDIASSKDDIKVLDDSITNTQMALCDVYELLMGGE